MGLLTDIIKEIPHTAVLQEKITAVEAKYAATETENSILKDDLREAKAEIAKLKKQVEELSHKEDLDETELNLLLCIGKVDFGHAVAGVLQSNFFQDLSLERVKYHLTRLEELGYARMTVIGRLGGQYRVTQNGRKLLLDKNLL